MLVRSSRHVAITAEPICLPAGNPGPMTGAGTNTWLIDGAQPALVDAGVGSAAHLDAIADALGGRPLARLLITHNHPDHALGIPAICARWPEVQTVRWPWPEGEAIPSGDSSVTAIHTPGHAAEHLCFWNADTRDLFGGDMVIAGTTVMIPAARSGGSLREYLRSLDRLAALDPLRILPGHGDIVRDPQAIIAAYKRHRREREDQIRACLNDGVPAADVDAIVSRIYGGLPEGLRPAARLTVQAHLEKIAEENGGPA